MRKLMPIALAILLLGACASPSDGPKVSDIRNASLPNSNERFPVVDLAQAPLGYLPATTADSAGGERGAGLSTLRRAGPAEMRLRPGDVIEVTILDRTEEGLMSAADSRALNLGRFTVDHAGFVQQPLRESRLTGVYMRQDPKVQLFLRHASYPPNRCQRPCGWT
jgi:polysaccharide biosynthesis/export protein